MKIITGSAKGRNIKAPKDSKIIRPALSQVREAIFSSLGDLSGKTILDIYAGTGSLGLEGLSRGCEKCYFIDSHSEAIGLIIENLKHLGFEDRAHVFKRKIPNGLSLIKIPEDKIDIIFCDPPYDKDLINPTLRELARQKYVDPTSVVIVEHTRREVPNVPEFQVVKEKRFGQTLLTYLQIA
jgi:16S rRNA (guanine966-N2)-methyltransferase